MRSLKQLFSEQGSKYDLKGSIFKCDKFNHSINCHVKCLQLVRNAMALRLKELREDKKDVLNQLASFEENFGAPPFTETKKGKNLARNWFSFAYKLKDLTGRIEELEAWMGEK